jgi:hypothetical protein
LSNVSENQRQDQIDDDEDDEHHTEDETENHLALLPLVLVGGPKTGAAPA